MSDASLQNIGIAELQRLRRCSLWVGLIACVPCLIGWLSQPNLFMPAYLTTFLYVWMISLGSLAIRLLHGMTGGDWGTAIQIPITAAVATLPRLGILFLPVLLQLPQIYLWAEPGIEEHDTILRHLSGYLNQPLFQLRAVGYFLIWSVISAFVLRSDHLLRTARPTRTGPFIERFAAPAFVFWVLTTTFAAFDWGMSLEPHWNSSIYGVLYVAGEGVSALAFAVTVVLSTGRLQVHSERLSSNILQDLGNLLLAFTLFWTYIELTQFLVIWSGNLPEEAPWYLRRQAGGWFLVILSLVGFHFIFPFMMLLSRTVKRSAQYLRRIAILLLIMRLIDLTWLILPAYETPKTMSVLFLPLTFAAVGGLWLAEFLRCWGNQIELIQIASPIVSEVRDE